MRHSPSQAYMHIKHTLIGDVHISYLPIVARLLKAEVMTCMSVSPSYTSVPRSQMHPVAKGLSISWQSLSSDVTLTAEL